MKSETSTTLVKKEKETAIAYKEACQTNQKVGGTVFLGVFQRRPVPLRGMKNTGAWL
jgi:hypothetical protein